MTQASTSKKHPRNPTGKWRRKRPWERREQLKGGVVAYAISGDAAAFVERFWTLVQPIVLVEWDFPQDGDLPEDQLPQPGVYRLEIFPHIYFLEVDRFFRAIPNAPRWRVRGRLLSGPLTDSGKRPLVAMTLAQFKALKPVYIHKECS